jgi:peptidyl-prolyl cis-trans isomerase C
MKRQEGLQWLILVVVLLLGGVLTYDLLKAIPSGVSSTEDTTVNTIRDYAATLKANQLYAKAAEQYDHYLAKALIPDSEKARVDFNTGTMLLDELGDAEGALAHFLRVTDLYQGVDPQLVKESRKLASECLEKLGRAGAAEHQLVQASKVKTDAATAEVKVEEKNVLATIGDRISISRVEFDEAWKTIPQYSRDQAYSGEQGKEKFLQEMLSVRLFADAARRKGLDRDPEIQRRRRSMEESLLASKLFKSEVVDKVSLIEPDLKLFYEAHKDHYKEPASREVAHILTADITKCVEAKACIEKGSAFASVARIYSMDSRTNEKGGVIGKLTKFRLPLDQNQKYDPLDIVVPGIGKSPELTNAAFAIADIDQVTGPIKSEKGYHLLKLVAKTEDVAKSFEEVRSQVESDFRLQREEQRKADLIAELIKANQVRVYANRLKD